MTRILLTRHAQSEWNALGRWQGRADSPLSELGHKQAQAAGDFILSGSGGMGLSFDAVATSPLARAADTGRHIAKKIGFAEVENFDSLIERDVGVWSGLSTPEIEKRYPNYLDTGRRPEGYEDADLFFERIMDGFVQVCQRFAEAKTILVVAHGGLIYQLEARVGIGHNRIENLGARWIHFNAREKSYELGARINLLAEFGR